MKFYFAPLEGLTGYIYRNAHHALFDPMDKYFTPFIIPNQNGKLRSRDLNDILPENNCGLTLIPQLLTNNARDFINTSRVIEQLGYSEINLNLGCPSGTVVSKNRGAGFLAKKEELDAFLEEIFTASVTRISVKTRIGKAEPEEFYDLIEIFNRYPMSELIIHPRVREDYYKNKPNLNIFRDALRLSKNPVCYNGDICTVEDYNKITSLFPEVEAIMLGRGLLANPNLISEIKEHRKPDRVRLKDFHDRVYEGYKATLYGDRNILFKMKELWSYMLSGFEEHEKIEKKIKKAERLYQYEEAVSELFSEKKV